MWDVSSKNVLQRLDGHTDAVLSVHTHPSEELIVSAGLDRTIRLWRPNEGKRVNGVKTDDDDEGKPHGEGHEEDAAG